MTILYDIISPDTILECDNIQKKEFISEIILLGKYHYFDKFKVVFESIKSDINSSDILAYLPMVIDPKLFQWILTNFKFEQGQHFFYNYAYHNENPIIKELVYNYFVDNYSHIMLDNMSKYEVLLQK